MAELPHKTDAEWLEAVRAAHFKRAEFYYRIYGAMRDAFGEAKALELIGQATYAAGRAQDAGFQEAMKEASPAEFCRVFCTRGDVGAKLFEMEAGEVEDEGQVAIARLHRCALVEGWKAMGVPEEEIAKLCRAAHQTDLGKLAAAGMEGEFTTLLADGGCCCTLRVWKADDKPDAEEA